jgi:alpha-L-rhamnosidase
VEGVVLHNDMPVTGAFECSDPLLNQLFSNQQWGQRGNYLEVPTDCPQRDERLGWTGDAQVFAPTACYNMDASGFFAKWLQDLRDAQGDDGRYPKFAPDPTGESLDGGPAWAEAGVICAWRAWLHYGDRRLLETHYDSMCRFIGFLDATSEHGLRPIERDGVRMGYGDWLALDGGEGRRGATPLTLVGTAYHVYAVDLMARIARALGRTEGAAGFSDRAQALRRAFVRSFLDEQGCVQGDTQTGYLLALAFDLLPAPDRPRALAHLVARLVKDDDHLSTGFVGTPLLCPALTRFGRADLAYRIVMQRTYPGWLYSVLQGATTMWERWNSYTHEEGFGPADMNSFNHYAYGAIGQWFYEAVLGIAPLESNPGFAEFEAKPIPGGGLSDARGHLDTMRGRIESAWHFEADIFSYQLTVPPNARAHVTMPFEAPIAQHEHAATSGGRPVLSLAPGRHELSQRVPKTARTSLTP